MTATTRTYSLSEVSAVYLPAEWTDAERWLRRRLNRGEISGYRVGRVWRMRQQDVDDMVEKRLNTTDSVSVARPSRVGPLSPVSVIDGLSERSRRRLAS